MIKKIKHIKEVFSNFLEENDLPSGEKYVNIGWDLNQFNTSEINAITPMLLFSHVGVGSDSEALEDGYKLALKTTWTAYYDYAQSLTRPEILEQYLEYYLKFQKYSENTSFEIDNINSSFDKSLLQLNLLTGATNETTSKEGTDKNYTFEIELIIIRKDY